MSIGPKLNNWAGVYEITLFSFTPSLGSKSSLREDLEPRLIHSLNLRLDLNMTFILSLHPASSTFHYL